MVLLGMAATVTLVHLLTNNRYGFHRDELQFLSDARHLDWGFVSYPPLTPFLERIGLGIFGVSLVGLRLFSVIAQALAVFVTGLMARDLRGGRMSQVAAALAVALSPLPLFEGTEFQYTTFDYLWWVLIAYFVIRLLKTENQRWWPAIGATVGVGLMTIFDPLSCCWDSRRCSADASSPFSPKPMVLGRDRPGDTDLSAEFRVAGAAWIHFAALPQSYSCARHR